MKFYHRNADAVSRNCAIAKTSTLKMSRFAPLMQLAAETLCASRLDAESFAFVMQPPPGSGFGGMPFEELAPGARVVRKVTNTNRSLSVRTHTRVTQGVSLLYPFFLISSFCLFSEELILFQKNQKKVSTDGTSLENALKAGGKDRVGLNGARIIVFISGGMTYSEMRAITDLANSCKREVILGSTHIIRPEDFVHNLELLGDDEAARQYLEAETHTAQDAIDFYKEAPENAPAAQVQPPEPEPLSEDLQFAMETNDRLWWTTWIFTKIPGCGRVQRYLDGEDSDDDDDDDDATSFKCCQGKPKVEVPTSAPQPGHISV